MRWSMVLFLTLLVASALGCTPELPPARYATVTGLLPTESAFVLIGSANEEPRADFDARIVKVMEAHRGNFLAQIYGRYLVDLFDIDPLDIDEIRAAGLNPQGDFAVFALDVWPAVLINIDDRKKFDAFIQTLRDNRPGLDVRAQDLYGHEVQTLGLGSGRLSYAIHEGYLFATFHRADVDLVELLRPLLDMDPKEALGRSAFFDIALNNLGEGHELVLLLNTAKLDETLISRVDIEADPLLPHLNPKRREQYLKTSREQLRRCRDVGRFISDRVPYAALGSTLEGDRWRQRAVIRLDPVALKALQSIFLPLPQGVDELFDEAILAFAINASIPEIARSASGDPKLLKCPNLAVLDGATGVLGRALAQTDANEVFGASLYGALYQFDIAPEFMSARRGLLIFEAAQPEVAASGFAMFFEGIGVPLVEENEGVMIFEAFGALRLSVVALEGHVVLMLGQPNMERLKVFLAQPRAIDKKTFALLKIDGERLHAMLDLLLSQLSLAAPINQDFAAGFLELVQSLSASQWKASFHEETIVIEIDSALEQPN